MRFRLVSKSTTAITHSLALYMFFRVHHKNVFTVIYYYYYYYYDDKMLFERVARTAFFECERM